MSRTFVILSTYLVIATTGEGYPKYTDLNKNPGLLPLKLGNAQVKIDHWSFIQIFDISNVINEFTSLQNSYRKIKFALENSTTPPI